MGNSPLFLCWHAPFETGLEPIDTQHRELVAGLQRLEAAVRAGDGRAGDEELAFVARHLVRHCQAEESLMREIGFPNRFSHADEHQALIRGVRGLQYRRLRGGCIELEDLRGLGEALARHILEADGAYAAHLKDLARI